MPASTLKSSLSASSAPRMTDGGRILLGLTLGSGILCLVLPVFGIWTTCLLFFCISWLAAWVMQPRITITGRLPHRAMAGQTMTIQYTLTNRGHFCAYDLALQWADLPREIENPDSACFLPCIQPGQSVEVKIRLRPLRRGQYQFPGPSCISTFPFHFFCSRGFPTGQESLLVVPNFGPLDSLGVSIARRYHRGGFLPAGRTGESPEYIGNRPFRPGDEPRKIDSRAWARLSTPVVKEYHEEYFGHVALVLDTDDRAPQSGTRTQFDFTFEAAVSLTAAIAQNLSDHDNIVNVLAAGDKVYDLMVGRHIHQFDRILEVLAGIELSAKGEFDGLPPALIDALANTSTVVYVLLHWDAHREQCIQRTAQRGCRTVVFILNSRFSDRPSIPFGRGDVIQTISPEQIEAMAERRA
ncbi:MAG: DUF58 domain-containing protein [Sedimentisphaerales bacterium]|nr:DUF58 domain-containing protein [Sedimentisphaerales bacterium]